MAKQLRKILKKAIGSEREFSFEDRLVIAYVLYGGIMCFASIFINFWLGLGLGSVLLMICSTIFLGIVYYLGRIQRKHYTAKLLLSSYALLFCNVHWYMNYGSQGSATYVFLVYFFIMIFAWDKYKIRVIAVLTILNVLVLFAIEITIPNIIPPYPSESVRIIDSYGTLAIVLGFFAIIIVNAKNNYVKQYLIAQKSDKLKSAFLANMSHEIRTPLNAIIGFSQLLIERDLSREKKDRYSQLITENGDYLMKLISDILDVSMIESGHLKVVKSRVNLNNIFNHVYCIHNEILQSRTKNEVELKLEIPAKPVIIEVDEMRLKQVIFNLINNAVKYTNKGHVRFGYSLGEEGILFFIEDTGCGIKEEFQSEIFNRFVRHEETHEVKTTRGSGIGLSLTKELVHILGGKIWFTSEYKLGTTFYFSLPA